MIAHDPDLQATAAAATLSPHSAALVRNASDGATPRPEDVVR